TGGHNGRCGCRPERFDVMGRHYKERLGRNPKKHPCPPRIGSKNAPTPQSHSVSALIPQYPKTVCLRWQTKGAKINSHGCNPLDMSPESYPEAPTARQLTFAPSGLQLDGLTRPGALRPWLLTAAALRLV